jgi:hypothetical protein
MDIKLQAADGTGNSHKGDKESYRKEEDRDQRRSEYGEEEQPFARAGNKVYHRASGITRYTGAFFPGHNLPSLYL